MIKVRTDQGEITISSAVFTTITGAAATNCFGVKGMAYRSMTDGLVHLLRREAMSKGVKVTYNEDGTVSIELHIVVENGVNIATVCRSIMSEVKLCGHQKYRRGGPRGQCVRGLRYRVSCRSKEKRKDDR